jgi:formate dehydrogenase iron-sulfur subunit
VTAQPPDESRTLIDELLAEQQQLTAVDRFARWHERESISPTSKSYRDLVPLARPQPGQQYAFEVDLDKCSGCKACVSACHSLNGLDDGESWRDVGLLFSSDWRRPFQQTVTTACHHCADPGCLNGCPVLAYDKDPVTGIVRHLDDQCIGCQYCVMKCPYDVPKYSASRGIVRKCDLCANRLAVGEAPACAQACPHEAIRITLVDRAEIVAAARRAEFLPGAPDPNYTLPSTRYKSSRPIPKDLLAGDHARVTPSEAHAPLVFLLVLTQLAVGASIAALFAGNGKWLTWMAAAVSGVALGIASLHLGKPLKAWRSFLGWRTSWFSREVIAFAAFVPLTAAAAMFGSEGNPERWIEIAAVVVGVLGVASSAMIYADTRREFWRASQCFGKFFGTTLLLGAAAALAMRAFVQPALHPLAVILAGAVLASTLIKFGIERRIYSQLVDENTYPLTPLNKSARLLAGELGVAARARVACGIAGGLALPALLLLCAAGNGALGPGLSLLMVSACVAGELLERYLFFAAVAPVKMPGGVAA